MWWPYFDTYSSTCIKFSKFFNLALTFYLQAILAFNPHRPRRVSNQRCPGPQAALGQGLRFLLDSQITSALNEPDAFRANLVPLRDLRNESGSKKKHVSPGRSVAWGPGDRKNRNYTETLLPGQGSPGQAVNIRVLCLC